MVKAFVFGKFLPFHKGHEAMIHFASGKCDILTVLVCCSDKESVPGSIRKDWIEKSFESSKNIIVEVFNYTESDLPNTSDSSESVSAKWAATFNKLFPGYSVLITSENYGDFVAGFMNIEHIPFDKSRELFPVSSTAIRKDLFKTWQFLPDSVKAYYAIKIVISGTESTGKTTLCKNLAGHLNCSLVSEAGRDLIDDSKAFCFEDLHMVAAEHAKRIQKAASADSPLIIIDTDIFITKSYARFIFKKELEVATELDDINRADLYLYLNNDVQFFQDGTRLNEEDRNLLDLSHRKVLQDHNISVVEIMGDWNERFQKSIWHINQLINSNKYCS